MKVKVRLFFSASLTMNITGVEAGGAEPLPAGRLTLRLPVDGITRLIVPSMKCDVEFPDSNVYRGVVKKRVLSDDGFLELACGT